MGTGTGTFTKPILHSRCVYAEIEGEFLENALNNIKDDTKKINMFDSQFNFGQIELLDARNFLKHCVNSLIDLESTTNKDGKKENWIVNIASIEEECSYLYSNCTELVERLMMITASKALENTSNGGSILVTPRLWLRKELLKELMISQDHERIDM